MHGVITPNHKMDSIEGRFVPPIDEIRDRYVRLETLFERAISLSAFVQWSSWQDFSVSTQTMSVAIKQVEGIDLPNIIHKEASALLLSLEEVQQEWQGVIDDNQGGVHDSMAYQLKKIKKSESELGAAETLPKLMKALVAAINSLGSTTTYFQKKGGLTEKGKYVFCLIHHLTVLLNQFLRRATAEFYESKEGTEELKQIIGQLGVLMEEIDLQEKQEDLALPLSKLTAPTYVATYEIPSARELLNSVAQVGKGIEIFSRGGSWSELEPSMREVLTASSIPFEVWGNCYPKIQDAYGKELFPDSLKGNPKSMSLADVRALAQRCNYILLAAKWGELYRKVQDKFDRKNFPDTYLLWPAKEGLAKLNQVLNDRLELLAKDPVSQLKNQFNEGTDLGKGDIDSLKRALNLWKGRLDFDCPTSQEIEALLRQLGGVEAAENNRLERPTVSTLPQGFAELRELRQFLVKKMPFQEISDSSREELTSIANSGLSVLLSLVKTNKVERKKEERSLHGMLYVLNGLAERYLMMQLLEKAANGLTEDQKQFHPFPSLQIPQPSEQEQTASPPQKGEEVQKTPPSTSTSQKKTLDKVSNEGEPTSSPQKEEEVQGTPPSTSTSQKEQKGEIDEGGISGNMIVASMTVLSVAFLAQYTFRKLQKMQAPSTPTAHSLMNKGMIRL